MGPFPAIYNGRNDTQRHNIVPTVTNMKKRGITEIYSATYIVGSVYAQKALMNTTTTTSRNPYQQGLYNVTVKTNISLTIIQKL